MKPVLHWWEIPMAVAIVAAIWSPAILIVSAWVVFTNEYSGKADWLIFKCSASVCFLSFVFLFSVWFFG